MSAILLSNMVIAHSLASKLEDKNLLQFYAPKIVITFFVWISFYCYVFTEGVIVLKDHLITNGYSDPNSMTLIVLESFYSFSLFIYGAYTGYYGYVSLKKSIV